MDEFALDFLTAADEPAQLQKEEDGRRDEKDGRNENQQSEPGTPEAKPGLRSRVLRRGILGAANMQDKLLEKYLTRFKLSPSLSPLLLFIKIERGKKERAV